jgi:hypothetical protein
MAGDAAQAEAGLRATIERTNTQLAIRQPAMSRGKAATASLAWPESWCSRVAVCASCARNILCAAGGKVRALACPIFPRAIRQSFHAIKRAGGSFPKWKAAPARITFSQYRNICHIGVTMSIKIFLFGYMRTKNRLI